MAFYLKSITENSWLVLGDNEDSKIGLLSKIRNNYILMIKGEKKQFLDRKEVNGYFKQDIFETVVKSEDTVSEQRMYFIKGFPVKIDNPKEVILTGNNLPLYSKKESSDVYFSAGYYCIDFPRITVPAYCPKLSSLTKYKYAGPFKTEIEMRTELARQRKLRNQLP